MANLVWLGVARSSIMGTSVQESGWGFSFLVFVLDVLRNCDPGVLF